MKIRDKAESPQLQLTASDGMKDWIQDATRPVAITLPREQRKKPGNAGSEPGTKIQRTLDALLLAWKLPR